MILEQTQLEFPRWGTKEIPPGRPTGIDLFAGCGGFSLGMQQGGVEVMAAVEFNEDACATLRANKDTAFPNMTIIQRDIQTLTGKQLCRIAGVKDLDVLFGGPPCQGFTTANLQRSVDDPRSKLMFEFVRMVREIKPRVFMIENVPGLMMFKDFFIFLLGQLEECGYVVRFNKLNAAGYGVPQQRVRILIHGDRKDMKSVPVFPVYTHFSEPKLKRGQKKPMFPASHVMQELFPVNGFPKELVHKVRYNKFFDFLINPDTFEEDLYQAENRVIFKSIAASIEEADMKKEKPGTCIGCGCHEAQACMIQHKGKDPWVEPCKWVNKERTKCSACFTMSGKRKAGNNAG